MQSELTIREIKEKQKQLKLDLKELLNKFHIQTGLEIKGKIEFGFTDGKRQHWTHLKYNNPF